MTHTLNTADSTHVVGYARTEFPQDQAVSITDRVSGPGLLLRVWNDDIENDLGFEQVVLTPADARSLAASLLNAADVNEARNEARNEAAEAQVDALDRVFDTLSRETVLEATQGFVDWINADATQKPEGYRYEVDTPGRKYVRIVMKPKGDTGGSVHAFVNLENGDLLKAAGWKAPAKGARGNVLTNLETIKDSFTWSGSYIYKR